MINFLCHLFLPRASNNYRSYLLHFKVIASLVFVFFSLGLLTPFLTTSFPSVLGVSSDITSQQLVVLTNEKRQENGDLPLVLNDGLSQAAANKATDMFNKNYWSHNAPDGTTPWVFIKAAGYNYTYAGENLARGYNNASDVVNAWMASPEHRQNMLSPNYQNVGFSIETGNLGGENTVLVVEMLGSTNLAQEPSGGSVNKEVVVPAAAIPSSPAASVVTTPALTPTPVLAQSRSVSGAKAFLVSAASQKAPLINSKSFSLLVVNFTLFLFIFILVLDMIVIEKKKIVRFVGHNLDHVLFLSLILFVILIIFRGTII